MIEQTTFALQTTHAVIGNGSMTAGWWRSVNHCVHAIDDDANFLSVLKDVFDSIQMRVRCYPSAERYLTTRELHDADCVLLDMRMPNMSGIEMLRLEQPRLVTLPTLILSAFHDTPDVVEAMRC